MKLIGKEKLHAFKQRHGDVRSQCETWEQDVLSADWKVPQDVKDYDRKASFLPRTNQVVFNLKGNRYRVGVIIYYPNQTVFVEWALTHAEYTKKFK